MLTKNTHDFVGINCYFRIEVSLHNIRKVLYEKDFSGIMQNKRHDLGWFVDSTSIYWLLVYTWNSMKKKKPIYITEHGISWSIGQEPDRTYTWRSYAPWPVPVRKVLISGVSSLDIFR